MTNKSSNRNKTEWMQQTEKQLQNKTILIIKQPQNNKNEKKKKKQ